MTDDEKIFYDRMKKHQDDAWERMKPLLEDMAKRLYTSIPKTERVTWKPKSDYVREFRGKWLIEDPGFVFAPYVPVMKDFPREDFDVKTKVMARYGLKVVRPEYYGTVMIGDLAGESADQFIVDDPDPPIAKEHDDYFWPHKNGCPLCKSDAYVGFMKVECSMSSCQNFVPK